MTKRIERRCLNGLGPDTPVRVPDEGAFNGEDFLLAPELREIGDLLLRDDARGMTHVVRAEVAFRWLWRRKAAKKAGQSILGKCTKVSGHSRFFSEADIVVEIAADVARDMKMTHWQLEACLYHELQHLSVTWDDERQEWDVRPTTHDVEMYWSEIAQYGAWKSDILATATAFAQMPLFGDGESRDPDDITGDFTLTTTNPDTTLTLGPPTKQNVLIAPDGDTRDTTEVVDPETGEITAPSDEGGDGPELSMPTDWALGEGYTAHRAFIITKKLNRQSVEGRIATITALLESGRGNPGLEVERNAYSDHLADLARRVDDIKGKGNGAPASTPDDGLTDEERTALEQQQRILADDPTTVQQDITSLTRITKMLAGEDLSHVSRIRMRMQSLARRMKLEAMDPVPPEYMAFIFGQENGTTVTYDAENDLFRNGEGDGYARGIIEPFYGEYLWSRGPLIGSV